MLRRIRRCRFYNPRGVICILYVCVVLGVVNFVFHTKLSKSTGVLPKNPNVNWRQEFPPNIELKNAIKKRVNVIILSQMSSGSTFFGNLFNLHPDVFFLYEPFHRLRRGIYGNEWDALEKERNDAYKIDFSNLLHDWFACSFQENRTLSIVIPPWIRGLKEFMSWRYQSPELTNEVVRKACKERKTTVAKIMQTRLPGEIGIQELQRACSSDPEHYECVIIHLVRDPRAVLSSLLKRKFFMGGPKSRLLGPGAIGPEGIEVIKQNAQLLCSQVEDNLHYVKQNWVDFQGHYKLVRYEDFLENVPKEIGEIYKFAGLPMVESMRMWIHEGIQPLKSRRKTFFIPESGSSNITDHWRFSQDPSLVSVFEQTCGSLSNLLGYIPFYGSKQMQHDNSRRLRSESIPFLDLLQTSHP